MFQSVPRSVTVIAVLHLVAALAFGVLAHVDPTNQFPDLVTNDDGHFAVGLYANRNIGIAIALLASLLVRSRLAIAGLMLARFATDVADFVMALTQELTGGEIVGQLVFFGLLFASELYVIRTVLRLERAHIATNPTTSEVTS